MEVLKDTMTSSLRFTYNFTLRDADPRPCQYVKANYQPHTLRFTLKADADNGKPNYDDLAADIVSLYGYKLKKDGTPGLAETKEVFYYGGYPHWITRLIESAIIELRAGK